MAKSVTPKELRTGKGSSKSLNKEHHHLEDKHSKISPMKYLTILNESDTDIYIDPLSEMYLLGTTIDYVNEDYTKGQLESKFVFEVDKDLMSSCGCGISFSPKVN